MIAARSSVNLNHIRDLPEAASVWTNSFVLRSSRAATSGLARDGLAKWAGCNMENIFSWEKRGAMGALRAVAVLARDRLFHHPPMSPASTFGRGAFMPFVL